MSLEHIEKIKTFLLALAPDIFGNPPVLFAYLYGSYATGLVHPFSDLDIGIYVEKISRFSKVSGLCPEGGGSVLKRSVPFRKDTT